MQKPLALALCSIALVAITFLQAQTTKTEVAFSGNHVAITDLGDKGSLLSNCSNGTVNVCRFDMNGKQLWTQSITYKKNFRPIFCESLNGEDFYVLMYWKSKPKGGTEGLTISRISTSDGKIETREHPEAAPGHALVAYATNTALYVVTSDKALMNQAKVHTPPPLFVFPEAIFHSQFAPQNGRSMEAERGISGNVIKSNRIS